MYNKVVLTPESIKAKELREEYNPNNLSPFPFENFLRDHPDLLILSTDTLPEEVMGAILYRSDANKYVVYISNTRTKAQQHFTTAHELGHYMLHGELLKGVEGHVDRHDMEVMFDKERPDITSENEKEANGFALELLTPKEDVKKAWRKIKSIEGCAEIFNVPPSIMAVRLEKLGLIG